MQDASVTKCPLMTRLHGMHLLHRFCRLAGHPLRPACSVSLASHVLGGACRRKCVVRVVARARAIAHPGMGYGMGSYILCLSYFYYP
jgi:hypothetical protein